jgi:hypothetical protein
MNEPAQQPDPADHATNQTPTPPTPPPPQSSPPPRRPKSRRSRIACLPAHVREEINQKLYDGWQFQTIGDWLYDQVADRDIPDLNLKTGDRYCLIWTRPAKDAKAARETCRYRIARWYYTHYPDWLREHVETSRAIRVFDRAQQLTSSAKENIQPGSIHGADAIIRALLLDTIANLHDNNSDPDKIIELINAWAKIR